MLDVTANLEDNLAAALMKAAGNRHAKCLDLLMKAGADVNMPTCTALMLSSYNGHYRCLDRLIKAGANVNKVDEKSISLNVHSFW